VKRNDYDEGNDNDDDNNNNNNILRFAEVKTNKTRGLVTQSDQSDERFPKEAQLLSAV